ncbi:MAG: response regulator, partial [Desulfoferrobacter sp.]
TTMPGMTGDQLIKEILKIRPDMKTILCTGYSERVDEESAITLGAKAYALKPLDRKQLALTVRKVLDESN